MVEDLPESRLVTFLDEPGDHALYFLEGQRLIRDLALVQLMPPSGFAYFRDFVLSVEPLIALMKGGEHLGFYLDSDDPPFLLKIETGHDGDSRCLLVPSDFAEFPDAVSGTVRVRRHSPGSGQPYQSDIAVDGLAMADIVNEVLEVSWQVKCAVVVSQSSDQSAMLHRLPAMRSEGDDVGIDDLRQRMEELAPGLERVFERALTEEDEIVEAMRALGFRPLASRPVRFHCSCSHERFVEQLRLLNPTDPLFDPGQKALSVSCDYCRKEYVITRAEVEAPPDQVH